MKLAMIRVYRRLMDEQLKSRMILQIHDELLIETLKSEEDKVKAILEEEMSNAADLAVPLDVDCHVGTDWFEAK
jgi:DNA polymerase-1